METLISQVVSEPSTVVIDLPAGAENWAIGGVTFAVVFATIQAAARTWLRVVPWARRIRPALFAGNWDEGVDAMAEVLVRISPQFAAIPQPQLNQVLHDPVKMASLIASDRPVEEATKMADSFPNEELWRKIRRTDEP